MYRPSIKKKTRHMVKKGGRTGTKVKKVSVAMKRYVVIRLIGTRGDEQEEQFDSSVPLGFCSSKPGTIKECNPRGC